MLVAKIERNDGSTYEQKIMVNTNVREALEDLQEKLGKNYLVIDWWWA